LCNYTLLPATVKVLETFLEAILWQPFQLYRCILSHLSSIRIATSLQCLFQTREQVKISWSRLRRIWGWSSVVTLFFAKKSLTETDRCAGAMSPFFGPFPSNRIPKATKDVNVHIYIHSRNSCKLYQRIPGPCWSYYVKGIIA
jgi:hypothetical protein